MAMKERKVGGVAVFELSGNLLGDDADKFQGRLHSLKSEGTKIVVLDMGGVHLMNSSGVGMIIAGMKTLREVDGDLKLARLPERPYSILAVSRLLPVFDVFKTVDEAVAASQ